MAETRRVIGVINATLEAIIELALTPGVLPNEPDAKLRFRDQYLAPLLREYGDRPDIPFRPRACLRFLYAGLTCTLHSDNALRRMLRYADLPLRMDSHYLPNDVRSWMVNILQWGDSTLISDVYPGIPQEIINEEVREAVVRMVHGLMRCVRDIRVRRPFAPVIALLKDDTSDLIYALRQGRRICYDLHKSNAHDGVIFT
jgi:hypothetical protein